MIRSGWGGRRPGAGRKTKPAHEIAEKAINQLIKEFKKSGESTASNPARELAFLAYRSQDEKIRLKALTAYFALIAERKVHHTHYRVPTGPTIYLPAKEGSKEEAQLLRERGYVKAERAETDQVREDGQGPVDRRSLKH